MHPQSFPITICHSSCESGTAVNLLKELIRQLRIWKVFSLNWICSTLFLILLKLIILFSEYKLANTQHSCHNWKENEKSVDMELPNDLSVAMVNNGLTIFFRWPKIWKAERSEANNVKQSIESKIEIWDILRQSFASRFFSFPRSDNDSEFRVSK